MIKKSVCALFAAVILFTVVSCAQKSAEQVSPDAPYSFTDSEGTAVTVKKRPQKVAVLFSSLADVWVCAGGKVDITVGESVERGFAGSDAVIVDPGTGHSTVDLEALAAAAPDFVIGTADYDSQREAVDFCRKNGIPSALFSVDSFDGYLSVLKIFCDITEKPENYTEYGENVKNDISAVLESVKAKQAENEKILFVRAGSSAKSTKAKNSTDNFACAMLSDLGCVNIADSESALAGSLSLEIILDENPDFMFISTMGDEDEAKSYMSSLLESDGWRDLSCVKNGNFVFLPKELFHYKPNARWAEAYRYLADILYPEK